MSPSYRQNVVNVVLPALKGNAGRTAKEIGAKSVDMSLLLKDEQPLIKVVGKVVTGKRGRPAHKFALTDRGRKQAARLVKAQAQQVA